MKAALASIIAAVTFAIGASAVTAGQRSAGPVIEMLLPLKLPAVGNIEAVHQWRFGRFQQAEMLATSSDVILLLRTGDGIVHRVIGPGPQLTRLARRSNWMKYTEKSFPTDSDYAERMIAFDVDSNGRLIAMMSLEPVPRDRNRLSRAIRQ